MLPFHLTRAYFLHLISLPGRSTTCLRTNNQDMASANELERSLSNRSSFVVKISSLSCLQTLTPIHYTLPLKKSIAHDI